MQTASCVKVAAVLLALVWAPAMVQAETLVDVDFGKGDFATLGWKADGAWDIFNYPNAKNNPGFVARCRANEAAGGLSKTFAEVKAPKKLELSVDAGWGWGSATHGDNVGIMLLDAQGNGYVFSLHRANANWAMQWAKVSNHVAPRDRNWAKEKVDGSHQALLDSGVLDHLTISRDEKGNWTFTSRDANKGAGATFSFTDTTTASFAEVVLVGYKNINELAYNKVRLEVEK